MLIRCWVAAWAVLGLSAAEPSLRRLDGSRITVREAEAFAQQTLAELKVTGAQVAMVDRGKLVWSASFGYRNREQKLPFEKGTMTWAASITKGVFATYVMQLVERGELSLDEPVAKMLPKPLDQYEPYRETASELVKDPQWPKVTPRMLLSHTAGFANFVFLEPDKKMHLHFAPGTKYSYSGEGFNLLQYVIEQKKGKTLDALMQESLFGPLGMTRSGMIYRQEFGTNIADRYDENEKFLSQTRRSPARGAGSLTTTAEDLAKLAIGLMDGKVIRPATRQKMLTPVIQLRMQHQFAVAANEPESAEAAAVGLAYGVGWGLLTKTKFGLAFFKEGHGDGAVTHLLCFPKRKACFIVLTNSENGTLAFRPLMEKIFGDTVTPWEWEGYTPEYVKLRRQQGQ